MNNHFKWRLLIRFISMGFTAVMLYSCSIDEAPLFASEYTTIPSRSNSDCNVIDAATAEQVAVKFSTIPVDGVENEVKSVSNTVEINNTDGAPVMYAVNFAANGGYVIVSASRATSPIIAYSETGRYDYNQISSGFRNILDRVSLRISDALGYPNDSVEAHYVEWYRFLTPEKKDFQRFGAYSFPDYYPIIVNAEEQWIQMGYEVCPIQQWYPGGWPMYRELSDLDKMVGKLTMPVDWADGIPANQLCYIVIQTNETIYDSSDQCNPLTTRWSVGAPYNSAVPDGMMLSPEAVALGQMLHYYKDPAVMAHSRSENNPLQDNTEISTFLYEVAKNVNTVFGTTSSHSSIGDITNALSNRYRYDFVTSKPSENTIISSIDKGSPVMIVGYDAQGASDSWICSRYQRKDVKRKYMLMAPLGQPGGIFGPYEICANWDDSGIGNFYFDCSLGEYLYVWIDYKTLGFLNDTSNYLVFGDISKYVQN